MPLVQWVQQNLGGVATQYIDPAIAAGGRAVGTPTVELRVDPSSVAGTRAVGTPALELTVSPSSVAGGRTVGVPALDLVLSPSSVAGSRAVGAPSLELKIDPASVAGLRAVGTPQLEIVIAAGSVAGSRTVGTPVVEAAGSTQFVDPASVSGTRAVGEPSVDVPSSAAGGGLTYEQMLQVLRVHQARNGQIEAPQPAAPQFIDCESAETRRAVGEPVVEVLEAAVVPPAAIPVEPLVWSEEPELLVVGPELEPLELLVGETASRRAVGEPAVQVRRRLRRAARLGRLGALPRLRAAGR